MKTIEYSSTDGQALKADLFMPDGSGPFPLIVAVPGGGWIRGHRSALRSWGELFAKNGFAFASVDYRRASAGAPAFPGNLQDVEASLHHFAAMASTYGIDGERIGILGASAGGHLAALASLSSIDCPAPKAFAGIYGVYDLMAHWQADRAINSVTAPDKTELLLGASPFSEPLLYHQASPLRQISHQRRMPVFLCWGHLDREVSPQQSAHFAETLRQAGYPVTALELPDAAHLWFSEEDPEMAGTHSARLAAPLLRFFERSLKQ